MVLLHPTIKINRLPIKIYSCLYKEYIISNLHNLSKETNKWECSVMIHNILQGLIWLLTKHFGED